MDTKDTSSFNEFLTNNLNAQQRKGVIQKNGIFVVCAGAGSGKTRVITARITNLILNENVPPTAIVALTFTNKAAHEMKERVQSFLPPSLKAPYVGTFHAYCVRLLRTYQHLLPFQEFSILDEDDQKTLLQKIITTHGLQKKVSAKQISYAISNAKNGAINGIVDAHQFTDPTAQQIFKLYEDEKKRARCFDFDDLLLETLLLFKKNPLLSQNYQQTIRHVLVDEYQDTNAVQHALLKAMACDLNGKCMLDSLCVVGDEDQSIYSWRGATVHNIVNFKKDFPDAHLIAIEQNYRSAQPILNAANSIIRHNKVRNPKNLWSTKDGNDRIRVVQTTSEYQESDFIAELARATLIKNTKNHPAEKRVGSCAVLYRSHYQSRAIEEVLIRQSIPYRIIGGIQFYERQEIKDLLAYLRLIVNPFDRVSFLRVFNTPSRGLGDQFEELFFDTWQLEPFLTFHEVADHILKNKLITPIKEKKLKEFLEVFSDLSADKKASIALAEIIKQIRYFEYLNNSFDAPEAVTKIENVKELMSAMQSLEEEGITTLTDFLNEVALLQDHAKKSTQETDACLFLMTLHAAKGLEFDTVALAGLEEGLFPSARSIYDPGALEEERRLLYVGITRAREHLLITQSSYRYMYGTLTPQQPSRFLREIPNDSARFDEAGRLKNYEIRSYIESWLSHTTKKAETPPIQPAQTINFDWDANPFGKTTSEPIKKPSIQKHIWKKLQPVQHKKFGTGIVQEIEEKDAGSKIYLTVKFPEGIKKIDAKFVEPV
jgi:DNA helicase II / ATP-dependent DNA helicase PcrA